VITADLDSAQRTKAFSWFPILQSCSMARP
jgi:hypothetical protein